MTILSNGDVVPCCYDLLGDAILGNICHNTIFEIRDNKKSAIFYGMAKGKAILKICQN